jgi:hypothetical protein
MRLRRTPLSTFTSKKPPPIVVGNLLERLRLKNAQVVYNDIHRRKLRPEQLGRLLCRKVADEAIDSRVGH